MEDSTSTMGQRVKLAELKAHLAEERAARNQALLNNKLQEVNQLQNTLNSQTKVCCWYMISQKFSILFVEVCQLLKCKLGLENL